jgi:hypothetical protein
MTDTTPYEPKPNLRPKEVAQLLDITPYALARLDIPFFYVGKRARRYRLAAVERWAAAHEVIETKKDSPEATT